MIRKPQTAKAPGHLSTSSKKWWASVVGTFELEPAHLHLLRLACESLDIAEEARKAIDTHGLTFTDRFNQPRPRPECAIGRDARTGFARLLRELGLDVSVPGDDARPPALSGNAGRKR